MFDLTSKCTILTGLYRFEMKKQIKIIFNNVKTRTIHVSVTFYMGFHNDHRAQSPVGTLAALEVVDGILHGVVYLDYIP